jgi:hypothetical protein
VSDTHYNGGMRGRLAASLIALVILMTGVMPAVAGYRCIAMGMRMQAPSPCCHHDDDAPALKEQCCEAVAAPRLEPRRTPPSSSEIAIQAPIVVGWIVFPPLGPLVSRAEIIMLARARGRPPGDQLQLLSTILRV